MWTTVFIIALVGAVQCICPWKRCDVDADYSMEEALLHAKDKNDVLTEQPGFVKELPGFHFLYFWWFPLRVEMNVTKGYLANLGDLSRNYWATSLCSTESENAVINTLEGTLSYDDLTESYEPITITFPNWSTYSEYGKGHYRFAFSYVIEYNSTFCNLTHIQWNQSEGSYVTSFNWWFPRLFKFDIPEEKIQHLKEQIQLYFEKYVVTAWYNKYRNDG